MYIMRLKDGQKGVAIVADPKCLDDRWEVEKPLTISDNSVIENIEGKDVEVHRRPRIKFSLQYSNNTPKLEVSDD